PGQFFLVERQPATLDDLRKDLFAMIDATPWLDWQLLTKRPENIPKMWFWPHDESVTEAPFRSNVWLGTSVSEQKSADQNIPELLKCRDLAPVLFVSYEPALGPIDFHLCPGKNGLETVSEADDPISGLDDTGRCSHSPVGMDTCPTKRHWTFQFQDECRNCGLDWIICGGESGSGFRPMDLDWARSARDQCRDSGVPFFFKQSSAIRTEMGI